MIELKQVNKTYFIGKSAFKALNNIQLKINKGENIWCARQKWRW